MHDPRLIQQDVEVRGTLGGRNAPFNSSGRPIGRRRNGLAPACEPCRKAKVKCDADSGAAVCSRCRKRKRAADCIFIDAPMTQQRAPTEEPKTYSSPAESSTSAISKTTTVLSGSASSNIPRRLGILAGYFGSTAFTATLRQNPGPVESTIDGEDLVEEEEYQCESSLCSPARLKLGIKVLREIPDIFTCHTLVDCYMANAGVVGFHKPSIKHILNAFCVDFGPVLEEPTPENLERVARDLMKNGQVSLSMPDDACGWVRSFSGRQTRWESLGILYVAFAYGLLSLPAATIIPFDQGVPKKDRKELLQVFKECIEACIELSRLSLNPVVCFLLYKNLVLETVIKGDSSISVWRLMHDLVAVAVAIGLHCYQGTPTVTMRSEMTKRLSACVFWNDKEIAMYTGRPPAMSHRFYSCPLPLDLSDEAIYEGGARLQEEIDNLDANGWNTKGDLNDSTICRGLALSARIQDEIMELFVGTPEHFSIDRVNSLRARTDEIFRQIPKIQGLTKQDYLDCDCDWLMWRLLFGRLDYLRLHFLIERLAVERGHQSKQALVDVSREILDLTVLLWLSRDRSASRLYNYGYIIMCYGMPSTGILCAELLKYFKHPGRTDVKLPVSEVVQNLSLMIGFLEWIRPREGNYKLCRRMSEIIRKILDQMFEPAETEENPQGNQEELLVGIPDNSNFWNLEGLDDFDWLNSVDWGKGPFVDFT